MIGDKERRQFVVQLIALTRAKRLRWERAELPASVKKIIDGIAVHVYTAAHNGVGLRIYERRSPYPVNEGVHGLFSKTVLEILNTKSESVWEIEGGREVADLLATVRFDSEQVDEMMRRVLAEERETYN